MAKKKKKQPESDLEPRGEDAFPGLEEDADEWCAGPQPDWIEVADIEDEADALRAAGKLDDGARRILLDRARDAIPEDRPEVFAATEAAIRRLA